MSGLFLQSISLTRTTRVGDREIVHEIYLNFSDQQPELDEGDLQRIVSEFVNGLNIPPKAE